MGRDLLRRKREHLAPGEMERLAIPAALLREAAGPLTVALDLGGGVIMKKLVCIVCPRGCRLTVEEGGGDPGVRKCLPPGETYARQELFRAGAGAHRYGGTGGRRSSPAAGQNQPIPRERV